MRLVGLANFLRFASCLKVTRALSSLLFCPSNGKSGTYSSIQDAVACPILKLLVCPKFNHSTGHNDYCLDGLPMRGTYVLLAHVGHQIEAKGLLKQF